LNKIVRVKNNLIKTVNNHRVNFLTYSSTRKITLMKNQCKKFDTIQMVALTMNPHTEIGATRMAAIEESGALLKRKHQKKMKVLKTSPMKMMLFSATKNMNALHLYKTFPVTYMTRPEFQRAGFY